MMQHQHMTNQHLQWILMELRMGLLSKKYQFRKWIRIVTEIMTEIHIFMKMMVIVLVTTIGEETIVVTMIAIAIIVVIRHVIEIAVAMIIGDIHLIAIVMKAVWIWAGPEMIVTTQDIRQMVDITVCNSLIAIHRLHAQKLSFL